MSNSLNVFHEVDLSGIEGAGFDTLTDSLVKIRDELTVIEGSGFSVATDTLEKIRDETDQIETMLVNVAPNVVAIINTLTGVTTFHNALLAAINAEVDDVLDTAIPGSPTAGSINERIEEFHNRKTYDSINYLISDDILHSNDDLVDSDEVAFAVKKKITCPITETIRIEFKIKTKGLAGQFAHGRIYKNGVALGTDQATSTVNWETFSEDLIFSASDLIELWCYGWPGPIGYQMKEFRILGIVYQEFENTMV